MSRWTSERAVLEELERLGDQSMALAADYARLAVEAAEAEAGHKRLRARRQLVAKANGVRSMAEAEVVAEADDAVAAAYLKRLTLAAQADSCREAIRSIRTNQDGLRTAAASHRSPIVGPGYQ